MHRLPLAARAFIAAVLLVAAPRPGTAQHVTLGPWYITQDDLWDENEIYDCAGDGAGRSFLVYRHYNRIPPDQSVIRLRNTPMSDADVLHLNLRGDVMFRVADHGRSSAFVGRLQQEAGGPALMLHLFGSDGRELCRQGGRRLSGGCGIVSYDLRSAADHGAIALWRDDTALYAQRVDSTGGDLWTAGGRRLDAPTASTCYMMAADCAVSPDGGVVAAWVQQFPQGGPCTLRAQRVTGQGVPAWPERGTLVDSAGSALELITVQPDTGGGAFICWRRDGAWLLQHLGADGAKQLHDAGLAIGRPEQRCLRVRGDARGGLLLCDSASIRRMGPDNTQRWGERGVRYSTSDAGMPHDCSADGRGGAFAVWNADDWMVGISWIDSSGWQQWGGGRVLYADSWYRADILEGPGFTSTAAIFRIRAERIDGYASQYIYTIADTLNLPTEAAAAASPGAAPDLSIIPSPLRGSGTLQVLLGGASGVRVDLFDLLGRLERVLVDNELPAGQHRFPVDLRSLPAGVYYVVLTAGEQRIARRIVMAR